MSLTSSSAAINESILGTYINIGQYGRDVEFDRIVPEEYDCAILRYFHQSPRAATESTKVIIIL